MCDRLCFFSRSRDAAPGAGAGESIDVKNKYVELSQIKDWRKQLSHFDFAPFTFEGGTYNTIEHAFQSKKISLVDLEKAKLFTVESGDKIGLGDGALAQKNRKIVKLQAADLARWADIQVAFLEAVALAKWRQHKKNNSRHHILLLTHNAELWHIQRGKPMIRFEHLEKAREVLLEEEKLEKELEKEKLEVLEQLEQLEQHAAYDSWLEDQTERRLRIEAGVEIVDNPYTYEFDYY